MTTDIRLPGRHHVLSSGLPEELWLCDDHLLCIKHAVFVETYQRFYYRDIESITVTVTKRFWILNLLFGSSLVFGIILLVSGAPMPAFCVFVVIWLIPTLINIAYGTTCKTELRTRVNTRSCTSLRRLRSTKKAIALLNERIRAAQMTDAETVPPPVPAAPEAADMPTEPPAVEETVAEPPPAAAVIDAPPPMPPAERVNLRWHQITVVLLAIQALIALNIALYPQFSLSMLLVMFLFVSSGFAVPALIAQRRSNVPHPAKVACWSASLFQFIVGYVVVMVLAFLIEVDKKSSVTLQTVAGGYDALFSEHGALRSLYAVYAVITFALATWLALTLRSVKRR